METLDYNLYNINTYRSLFVAVIVQAMIDYYSVDKDTFKEKNLMRYKSRKIQQRNQSLEAKQWFYSDDCKYICGLAGVNYDSLINFLENNKTLKEKKSRIVKI